MKDQHEAQRSELLRAVQDGNVDEVTVLLQSGLNPNYCDDEGGYTLIHWASQEGHSDIIKILHSFGADLNGLFLGSITPLINASGDGDEVVATLIKLGADINSNTEFGGTALHNACSWGHESIARMLLDAGADVNATNDESETALFGAVEHGHKEIIVLLLAYGASPRLQNSSGKLAVDALLPYREDIARLLAV